jgi:preprotein translocase subunit Sss1
MENKQTVDYIQQHLAGGHSEDSIRKHFLAYGWSESKVDDAFASHRTSLVAAPVAKASRPKRIPQWRRWSKARWIKTIGISVIGVIALGLLVHILMASDNATPPRALVKLNLQARQSNDINTIGGAISQYVSTNGVLPTRTSTTPEGSLVLCNTMCDPATSAISRLMNYKAVNVQYVPYRHDIIVPDDQTIYLVPGAKCKKNSGIGDPASSDRAIAIVYALSVGSTLSQRCVSP